MKKNPDSQIYIIGAGFAGVTIAKEIQQKEAFGKVAAFLDDDPSKIGTDIDGIPCIGPIMHVIPLLRQNTLDEALIAVPSAGHDFIKNVYEKLKSSGFSKIKILPAISQILEGDAHLVQTREIDPQDLLGRNPAVIGLRESISYLRGKRVLITGAGGSIGSELARQLLSGGAQRLYLFGHGENSIYQIDRELRILQQGGVGEKAIIVPIIGELKDRNYMFYILEKLKADVVFHCAAYKHVPLMEENPVAVVENNVFGTKNILDASIANNVKRFVLISTDKAVSPVSVYGSSKALCESLVQDASLKAKKGQAIMSVRFGNVLGSRGSFLPLFLDQIAHGGPVTVTDPKMIRYFMTIPEACSLVLKAGGVGDNGKMYLLDMGEPVLIKDIAEHLIKFYGFEPGKDIKIEYVGSRPGERLSEPLWEQSENPIKTEYPGILDLSGKTFDKQRLDNLLEALSHICLSNSSSNVNSYRNKTLLREILSKDFSGLRSI